MVEEEIWLAQLSQWIGEKQTALPLEELIDLSREWDCASSETECLLQSSVHLQNAFSRVMGKFQNL